MTAEKKLVSMETPCTNIYADESTEETQLNIPRNITGFSSSKH